MTIYSLDSFPNFVPVFCSMWVFNCCFLTYIEFSQETGKVVWYSHLFKNFPVCSDPHSQRFKVVNEAEVDVFLAFLCSMIQHMLAIWSLVPLPFLNPACISGSTSGILYRILANYHLFHKRLKEKPYYELKKKKFYLKIFIKTWHSSIEMTAPIWIT